MNTWQQVGLLAALGASCIWADVTYDEDFGSSIGGLDIEPAPLRVPPLQPSVFDGSSYSPGPFDPANTLSFKIYVKGNKMARVGVPTSSIYDLDAGTVTILDHEKRTYTITTFAAMERRIDKAQRGYNVDVSDTGNTMDIDGQTADEYAITVRTAPGEDAPAVAHSVYWSLQKPPSQELAAFQKRCLDKYGARYPAICSLTESNGFGLVARNTAALDGYPVIKIIESRMILPSGLGMNPSPADIRTSDRTLERAPTYYRIVRTETRISNFVEGPVDDAKFAIPKHYKATKKWFGR
jgi:hypothetical protein